jgi:hypothetical protein
VTGVAAILAGVLYFAGQAGELAFGNALTPVWAPSLHDLGLFVFEGAWVALGVALLRAERRRQPETASALA